MPVRRVFVLWRNPLFHTSVRLLLDQPKVEVVGATSDYSTCRDKIAELKPDLVIIEQASTEELNSADAVWIMSEVPRMVHLSLADNELSIFHRQHRTVAKADDLLQLVLEDPIEDQQSGKV